MKRCTYGMLAVGAALALAAMSSGCNSQGGDDGGAAGPGGPAAPRDPAGDGDRERPCLSSLALGDWTNLDGTDTLSFSADCSFRSSACSSLGQVANIAAESGPIRFSVASTAQVAGCLPAGDHDCTYAIYPGSGSDDGETMADIACPGGATVTYRRR